MHELVFHQVKFISLNMRNKRGYQKKSLRRGNAGFILLQETRYCSADSKYWELQWDHDGYFSHGLLSWSINSYS